MKVTEPLASPWKARLSLGFSFSDGRTILSERDHDGPLVVQKPLYPEGAEICHAIVVHPPGGIAGGDELTLKVSAEKNGSVLLTTPGAAKWYRSAGPWARQNVAFNVNGMLEWLPQETIVFDGALVQTEYEVNLGADAGLIGWDIVCLGRSGSGEQFTRGTFCTSTQIRREGKLLWLERGRIDGGSRLLESPAGLAGKPIFGSLFACALNLNQALLNETRKTKPEEGYGAVTLLPGILLARYLGDSSEAARHYFIALWRILRPALSGREASEPRIWRT
ncbi:MAG: urease accessory protein [Betaproteobacteria bacterium]|nr:urease accessory protein [Betaproteobacteria bacterium]MSQ88094.1 urease accessory protein [Betaproteobacteria bacterium]